MQIQGKTTFLLRLENSSFHVTSNSSRGGFTGSLGKGGKEQGKGGGKRLCKVLRDNFQGITKPAKCCLARGGGVKYIPGLIYKEIRAVFKVSH